MTNPRGNKNSLFISPWTNQLQLLACRYPLQRYIRNRPAPIMNNQPVPGIDLIFRIAWMIDVKEEKIVQVFQHFHQPYWSGEWILVLAILDGEMNFCCLFTIPSHFDAHDVV